MLNLACWTPFFGAQERDIFRKITVTPWTQFPGDNFSRNLITTIAFVPGSQETILREINSSLPVNAGWNTYCAMVSHARRSIDTSIVSQSRVQLIQCQCKSRLQIANLGINNAFLIKSSLFDQAVYIRHLVQTLRQFRSKSRITVLRVAILVLVKTKWRVEQRSPQNTWLQVDCLYTDGLNLEILTRGFVMQRQILINVIIFVAYMLNFPLNIQMPHYHS